MAKPTLFDHMRFKLLMGRCNRKDMAGRIFDCKDSGGWCDICKHQVPDGINWSDPHQFFIIAEDEIEDHRIDRQDLQDCAGHLGAVVVR